MTRMHAFTHRLSLQLFGLMMVALFSCVAACSWHHPPAEVLVANPAFDRELQRLLAFSVPVVGVEDLQSAGDDVILLDTRSREEYEVSHLPGARFVGYETFDPRTPHDVPLDANIVLYCSVGYRSEKIGERLQELGYRNVSNLYGSMFEWVNRGYEVVDTEGRLVEVVHTYNEDWSKWVTNEDIEKTW